MTAIRCPHCALPMFSDRITTHCTRCDWKQCPSCAKWFSLAKAPLHESENEE